MLHLQLPLRPAGQPVDLTCLPKALPAVVHIKCVQNSKVKTVDVRMKSIRRFLRPVRILRQPGQGNGGTRKRSADSEEREATGSGVIISQDSYIVTNHVVEGAAGREFGCRSVYGRLVATFYHVVCWLFRLMMTPNLFGVCTAASPPSQGTELGWYRAAARIDWLLATAGSLLGSIGQSGACNIGYGANSLLS